MAARAAEGVEAGEPARKDVAEMGRMLWQDPCEGLRRTAKDAAEAETARRWLPATHGAQGRVMPVDSGIAGMAVRTGPLRAARGKDGTLR